ncbi:MAG: hypothetical protein P4L50_26440, partial [Anaerolineaceae bacterium]|nr:hypothetical protein [Anaerolineaceae bacterium]
MNRKTNRSLFIVMAILMMASMLAACATPTPTAAPAAPAATTAPAAPAATTAPAAPAATTAPATSLAVGIVLPTKDEPRWIQDQTRFQTALQAAGYQVEILFSQGDSAKEKAN